MGEMGRMKGGVRGESMEGWFDFLLVIVDGVVVIGEVVVDKVVVVGDCMPYGGM